MKATIMAAAAALGVASALVNGASAAPPTHGSWTVADYTPDPVSLAAADMLHVATGATVASYCQGSRVPSAPQDVTTHSLTLPRAGLLKLHIASTGAWGLDVSNRRGSTLAGVATAPGAGDLSVRLPAGRYVVTACNLGGAPSAQVDYQLARSR